MKKLAIIGAGHLGMQMAYHAVSDQHYTVSGFFDDTKSGNVNGLPILGGLNAIEEQFEQKIFDCLMIGIGYNHLAFKQKIYDQLKSRVPFGKIVHRSSFVEKSAHVGNGAFILPGCVVDNHAVIEDNVLLNTSVSISHDSKIGAHSFLAPRVTIAGFCIVGKRCFLGVGTTLIDSISVTDDVQTGGATLLIDSIDQAGLYVGAPARFLKSKSLQR